MIDSLVLSPLLFVLCCLLFVLCPLSFVPCHEGEETGACIKSLVKYEVLV